MFSIFSQTASPLNKKLCEDKPKSFPPRTVEGKQAVERLKHLFDEPASPLISYAMVYHTIDTERWDK